jgi:hypothetical protein
MIKARLHFADSTPDRDLAGITEIVFKDGQSVWKHWDEHKVGFKVVKFEVGKIAYVQFGVR